MTYPVRNILSFSNTQINLDVGPLKIYPKNPITQEEIFNYLKQKMTIGKKKNYYLPQANGENWQISVLFEKKYYSAITVGNETIEIIDVREVPTETITRAAGYYPKTLWVTYKIKPGFENLGSIEGNLKVRYSIYGNYTVNTL